MFVNFFLFLIIFIFLLGVFCISMSLFVKDSKQNLHFKIKKKSEVDLSPIIEEIEDDF